MKVEVTSRKVLGSIKVPSSKSDAHRALICAALAKNQKSVINNLDINDDINATIDALRNLGARITLNGNEAIVIGSNLDLKELLEYKDVPAWIDFWGHDVNHDWPWWLIQFPYFVERVV